MEGGEDAGTRQRRENSLGSNEPPPPNIATPAPRQPPTRAAGAVAQAPAVELFWKVLVYFCAIGFLLLLEERAFSSNSRETAHPSFSSETVQLSNSPSLVHNGHLKTGEAGFFLLFESSDVELRLSSSNEDVDLYVVLHEDFDYFKSKSQKLRSFLETTPKRKGVAVMTTDRSFPWEVISPPQIRSTEADQSDTVYWSETPPFAYSSASLSEEKVHVPSAKELVRPLLICVFAPSNGVEARTVNYTLTMRVEKLHVSSYFTVRQAAEKDTLPYDELVKIFSTISPEDTNGEQTGPTSSTNGGHFRRGRHPERGGSEGQQEEQETYSLNPFHQIAKAIRPILLGLLEVVVSVLF
ncbi:hypothetical protein AAHC03_019435 [Spirometra sp. Aus1]